MKKICAILLSVLMLVSLCVPAGAFELEAVETVKETTADPAEVTDAALTAVDPLLRPGLNTVNGKTVPEDFESWTKDNPAIVSSKGATARKIENSPADVNGHAADKCVVLERKNIAAETYPQYVVAARMEKGRTYALAFNLYGVLNTTDICAWIMSSDSRQVVANFGELFGKAIQGNSWYSFENKALSWNKDSGNVLLIQLKAPKNEASDYTWYLDDLFVMPYYKINYIGTDGTVLSTEQVLYDAEGNVLTAYTPKADNYPAGVIGWSTERGASAPMTEITLANEDINLYPVVEPDAYFTYESDIISGKSGTTFTVTAADAASWSVDVGTTEATYTTDGNTLTVTAQGYAGIVTVTATDTNAEEHTHTFRLFSGEKWKPGLNTITGTTEAFDFEGISQEDIFATVTEKEGTVLTGKIMNGAGNSSGKYEPHWFLTSNPRVSDVNSSLTAVYSNYRFCYMRPIAEYNPKIEKERPVNYQFDVLSSGTLYTLINGAAGANVYTDSLGSGSADTWKHENITVLVEGTKHATGGAAGGIAFISSGPKDGSPFNESITGKYCFMDNISYIPYYKVTYIALDGETVAATEYVLYDEHGELLTTYTPDLSKVDGAYGYSLTKDGPRVGSVKLENKDFTLYASDATELLFGSKAYPIESETFTVPTPADAGEVSENFRVWLDRSGNKYLPGDTLSGETLDALIGMSFTPYYQDVTKPAMGFAFEGKASGNFNVGNTVSNKFSYTEFMEDDGRSILHARAYKWNPTSLSTDSRVSIVAATPFDAFEYNIISYTYKINTLKDSNLKDITAPANVKIYYNNGKGNGIWCSSPTADGCPGEHVPANSYYVTVTDDYQTLEIDMGLEENNITGHGWTAGGKISELHVDTAKIRLSGVQDTYIDSLRVYRDGIFTVTYDTNAPEYYEDLVYGEVEPDTGRGVGTGYLLSDKKPVVEGHVFRGWALTADATPDQTITEVDLTGDLTVYAVWSETPAAPTTGKTVSIRSGADGVNGIRFSATVNARTKAALEEYGFIVALEDTVGDGELTFNTKNDTTGAPLYVTGTAYSKSKGIDCQYDVSPTGVTTFTAVCVGIPSTAHATRMVIRPYAVFTNNGLKTTFYGAAAKSSLAEAAKAVRDAGGEAYEANKEYIDGILG